MKTNGAYEYVSWEEEGIWTAHAPSFPGVYGIGSTSREAEKDLLEALELMTSYLTEIGEPIPDARKIRTGQLRL